MSRALSHSSRVKRAFHSEKDGVSSGVNVRGIFGGSFFLSRFFSIGFHRLFSQVEFSAGFPVLSDLFHSVDAGEEGEEGGGVHVKNASLTVVRLELVGIVVILRVVVEPSLRASLSQSGVGQDVSIVAGLGGSVALLDSECHDHSHDGGESQILRGMEEDLMEETALHVSKSVSSPGDSGPSVGDEVPVGGVGPGGDLVGAVGPGVVVSASARDVLGEELVVLVNPDGVLLVNLNTVGNLSESVEGKNEVSFVDESAGLGGGLLMGGFAVIQALCKVTHYYFLIII